MPKRKQKTSRRAAKRPAIEVPAVPELPAVPAVEVPAVALLSLVQTAIQGLQALLQIMVTQQGAAAGLPLSLPSRPAIPSDDQLFSLLVSVSSRSNTSRGTIAGPSNAAPSATVAVVMEPWRYRALAMILDSLDPSTRQVYFQKVAKLSALTRSCFGRGKGRHLVHLGPSSD